jgi:hypothetical protein
MISEPGRTTGQPAIPGEGDNHAQDHFRSVACCFRHRRPALAETSGKTTQAPVNKTVQAR